MRTKYTPATDPNKSVTESEAVPSKSKKRKTAGSSGFKRKRKDDNAEPPKPSESQFKHGSYKLAKKHLKLPCENKSACRTALMFPTVVRQLRHL